MKTYTITEVQNKVLSCRTFKVVCGESGIEFKIDQESPVFGIAWFAYPKSDSVDAPIGVQALGIVAMRSAPDSPLGVQFLNFDLEQCEHNAVQDIAKYTVWKVLQYTESEYLK